MTTRPLHVEELDQQRLLERARNGPGQDAGRKWPHTSDGWGECRADRGSIEGLLDGLVVSTVEAGFGIHDCAGRFRTGGVCLSPSTQEHGVIVTWTTHDALMLDPDRFRTDRDVHAVMKFALAEVLSVLGWDAREFGRAGATIVVGPRLQEPEEATGD